MTAPWENLANAIILQAVKDYREARKKHKKRPKNEDAKLMIADCEAFFRSDWFARSQISTVRRCYGNYRRKKYDIERIPQTGVPPRPPD